MKNKIKTLISWDLDGTMFNTPTYNTGVPIWEKATGLSWEAKGWWSKPESLNLNIFYIPLNQWVYNEYIKYKDDEECYNFLATGRLIRLEKEVKKLLEFHNLDIDLFCNNAGETFRFKCKLYEKMIREHPNASKLILYDDRHEHLHKFVEWAKSQPIEIIIIDSVNKKIFS